MMNYHDADIVPPGLAAKQCKISRQAIYKRMKSGSIHTWNVYGESWVSIAEINTGRINLNYVFNCNPQDTLCKNCNYYDAGECTHGIRHGLTMQPDDLCTDYE